MFEPWIIWSLTPASVAAERGFSLAVVIAAALLDEHPPVGDQGERIKALRTAAGMTQQQLADRLTEMGYPMRQTMVAKMESSARPNSIEELYAVAYVLRVPFVALLPDSSDRETEARYLTMQRIDKEREHMALVNVSIQVSHLMQSVADLTNQKESEAKAAQRALDLMMTTGETDGEHPEAQ